MAFDTVKAGIAARLNGLGFVESSQSTDFKNAPVNEYGNKYILKSLSGENIQNTIIDRFYDKQDWQILIAFERSEQNDIVQLDKMLRAKDAIIKDLDKPANWSSFVKELFYDTWSFTATPNYYVLEIRLKIIDLCIYS